MEDLFDNKKIGPMLIMYEKPPFDSDDYLYELKLDGVRCLAYIDKDKVELINKRGMKLTAKFPELNQIYKQAKKRCILDGELYVYKDEKTDFFEVQKRTLMSDRFKIRLASNHLPVSYTAFDILYVDSSDVTNLPLMKRKKLLTSTIKENKQLSVSRYIQHDGIALYELTKSKGLEGIVAKKKDSIYQMDKKTKDWIKCKNLLDDDFVVTGYIKKSKSIVSLILGQYDKGMLTYKGHVTMGASLPYLLKHTTPSNTIPFSSLPAGNEEAIWIKPHLVGIVKFMEYTQSGGLRQPVFKGFRDDKKQEDCIVKK